MSKEDKNNDKEKIIQEIIDRMPSTNFLPSREMQKSLKNAIKNYNKQVESIDFLNDIGKIETPPRELTGDEFASYAIKFLDSQKKLTNKVDKVNKKLKYSSKIGILALILSLISIVIQFLK